MERPSLQRQGPAAVTTSLRLWRVFHHVFYYTVDHIEWGRWVGNVQVGQSVRQPFIQFITQYLSPSEHLRQTRCGQQHPVQCPRASAGAPYPAYCRMSLLHEKEDAARSENWIIGEERVLMVEICNSEESLCRLVSNGRFLWDRICHGKEAAFVSARYHDVSVTKMQPVQPVKFASNNMLIMNAKPPANPLSYPALGCEIEKPNL